MTNLGISSHVYVICILWTNNLNEVMVLGKKKKNRGDWSWNMTPEAYEAIKKLHENDKRAIIKDEDKEK